LDTYAFSEITPQLIQLAELSKESSYINPELYSKYDVKRGLRDVNGKGVLVGITDISEVNATQKIGDQIVPCDGQLFYRGYNVQEIVKNIPKDSHFGFEECTPHYISCF
jgi:citrate synthase